ncbi:MAG: PAS domain-containing sensor histidine kinase [Tepidiformaceae bacterium]
MSAPETLITIPRRWWETFSDLSSDAIFLIEPAAETIASWNAAASRLWGYSAEEVIGQPVRRLVPPDRTAEMDRIMDAARLGEPMPAFETVRLGKDGTPVDVSLATTPLLDDSGRPLVIIAIARDLGDAKATERRLAEAIRVRQEFEARLVELNRQLRQRIQDLETLLEVIPVGIGISYDRDCTDIRVNPAFAQILGMPADTNASMSGPGRASLPFRIMQDEAEVPATELPMQRAAAEGEPVEDVELDVIRDDGTIEHVLAFAAALLDDDGVPRGSVGAFVDITEKRKAEQELEQANAIKNEFLALVSHELRTPMTVIVGLARLLARGSQSLEPETFQQTIDQLRNDAEQLSAIIENMLVLARLDYEEAVREPLRLSPIIEPAVGRHRVRIPGRTIDVEMKPVGIAEGNRQWVEQVVGNLLSNAHKYSPVGAAITVHVGEREGMAAITVADRGHGLAANDADHLFEPFYRSRNAAIRPGLGVGLTVCRRLVELQGGEITVRPREGGGSEFTFTLPIVEDSEDQG